MKRIALLLLSSFLVVFAFAADEGESQGEQNVRAYEEFKRVDAEVTKVFEHQLTEWEKYPAVREALIASQRAWLTFREADGHYESVESEGGSARTYYVNTRMIYLTKQRIYQLKTPLAQGWVDPVAPGGK